MAAAAIRLAEVGEEKENVEFVDYDQDDDDAMEDDGYAGRALPMPQIVSPALVRTRGRFAGRSPSVLTSSRDSFDTLPDSGVKGHGPQRSIEGWTVIVSGIKEDAEEIDLHDVFSEFGCVKDLHYNLDRRTGFGKGYALIEYGSFEEAQRAIRAMNGIQLLTKTVQIDWAFSTGPIQNHMSTRPSRPRSSTPPRRFVSLKPIGGRSG